MQRCFLPHRGTEAGWTRASTGWVKVKGGFIFLQGAPECLRFCRYRAPLSRARPHFFHQVKLG